MSPLLVARGISWSDRGTTIVTDVSISLDRGESLVIMGPNGSGKTTLLRVLAGLREGYKGSIQIEGRELRSLSRGAVARAVSLVPQRVEQLPPFSVEDFIRLSGTSPSAAGDALVRDIRHKPLPLLSGGELQRAMIAGALFQGSSLLMLDEPTAHLDPSGRAEVVQALQQLQAGGEIASLIVTHDTGLLSSLATHAMMIASGQTVWQGSPNSEEVCAQLEGVYGCAFTRFHVDETKAPLFLPV